MIERKEELMQHPKFNDFVLLHACTPFADFAMEDPTGPWKPKTGRISVTSRQDISYPLTELLIRTAKTRSGDRTSLERAFSKLYKF